MNNVTQLTADWIHLLINENSLRNKSTNIIAERFCTIQPVLMSERYLSSTNLFLSECFQWTY